MRKIFSFPLCYTVPVDDAVRFLQGYRGWIHDVYCTVRVPPFMEDAKGFALEDPQRRKAADDMLAVQERTGITVSAIFNDIHVPPTMENLKLFMGGLRPLYEAGLRSVTIPHSLWLRCGMLKAEFPEMVVKNTVLRRVRTAQEYWRCCEAGFDAVNIDRTLMRDLRTLREIKAAGEKWAERSGRRVLTQLLPNEGCYGLCLSRDEHYTYACKSTGGPDERIGFLWTPLSLHGTCQVWPAWDMAYEFRRENVPPWKEDVDEILRYVDILKMHGRSDERAWHESADFMRSYIEGKDIIAGVRGPLMCAERLRIPPEAVDRWRRCIRTCRFNCWDCDVCDSLIAEADPAMLEQYRRMKWNWVERVRAQIEKSS